MESVHVNDLPKGSDEYIDPEYKEFGPGVPKHAEYISCYSTKYVVDVVGDSKIFPGQPRKVGKIFYCPRCNKAVLAHQMPKHGKEGSCQSCNLHMMAYGAGLYVW